jgi:hypothetical protein
MEAGCLYHAPADIIIIIKKGTYSLSRTFGIP